MNYLLQLASSHDPPNLSLSNTKMTAVSHWCPTSFSSIYSSMHLTLVAGTCVVFCQCCPTPFLSCSPLLLPLNAFLMDLPLIWWSFWSPFLTKQSQWEVKLSILFKITWYCFSPTPWWMELPSFQLKLSLHSQSSLLSPFPHLWTLYHITSWIKNVLFHSLDWKRKKKKEKIILFLSSLSMFFSMPEDIVFLSPCWNTNKTNPKLFLWPGYHLSNFPDSFITAGWRTELFSQCTVTPCSALLSLAGSLVPFPVIQTGNSCNSGLLVTGTVDLFQLLCS
jgi:hypothetical protein